MDMNVQLLGNGIIIYYRLIDNDPTNYVSIENHLNENKGEYDYAFISFKNKGYKFEKNNKFHFPAILTFAPFISDLNYLFNQISWNDDDIVNLIKSYIAKEL